MKYMLLFCHEPMDGSDGVDRVAAYSAARDEAIANGSWVSGEPLRSAAEGRRVSITDGHVVVTDGPFAEATDLLTGYFMLDLASIDDAVAVAARLPAAADGLIEVRQVWEHA